jgi:hypothetical protein
MHVSQLYDHPSPLAVASAPPFRHKEQRKRTLLRVMRLIADLTNHSNQQPPSLWRSTGSSLD